MADSVRWPHDGSANQIAVFVLVCKWSSRSVKVKLLFFSQVLCHLQKPVRRNRPRSSLSLKSLVQKNWSCAHQASVLNMGSAQNKLFLKGPGWALIKET